MDDTNDIRGNTLRWFTGKALYAAGNALDQLGAATTLGYWPKGFARSVRAALGKGNVAKRAARTMGYTYSSPKAVSALHSAMLYGALERLVGLTAADVAELSGDALDFYNDFRGHAVAMAKLDATRPAPTFTSLGVSPTVTRTLESLDAVAVEPCPMRFENREMAIDGKKVSVTVAILLWPEGTKHGASRYSVSAADNNQCQACGHAIKNPYNWVPLLLTSKSGGKLSLWVGRDCAERLFGIKMGGELEIEGR